MRRLKYRLTRRQRDLARASPATGADSSRAKASEIADAAQRSAVLCDMRGGVHASAETRPRQTRAEGVR